MISDAMWRSLEEHARRASEAAYCPYSGFSVGAAVMSEDGRIFSGCNVENASYGLTICAERNAIFQAVAAGARRIVAVAIFTPTEKPAAPCGACRQVINEFGPDTVVRSTCAREQDLQWTISELLPGAFELAGK
jgi:cytidine deaminase